MNPGIAQLKSVRMYMIDITANLTDDQLNTIPAGFSNNIIWNLAHLLASQQRICYMRSGNPFYVDETLVAKYKIETKPEHSIGKEEIETIKKLFIDAIDQFDTDYNNKIFNNYTAWTNPYGITISNIEDVISFLPFHEGLHTGSILALKKFV
jgi:DinB superfamily